MRLREIDAALASVPLTARLALIITTIVADEADDGLMATAKLVGLCAVMAQMLPPKHRAVVAALMMEEAGDLEATRN